MHWFASQKSGEQQLLNQVQGSDESSQPAISLSSYHVHVK